jgi:hypothetical protein
MCLSPSIGTFRFSRICRAAIAIIVAGDVESLVRTVAADPGLLWRFRQPGRAQSLHRFSHA